MILAVVLVKGTGIPVGDPGGRSQGVGAVCHQELDGGGTCGNRLYPDRSEYNFKNSDTVISDHGGTHRGDSLRLRRQFLGKALGWLFSHWNLPSQRGCVQQIWAVPAMWLFLSSAHRMELLPFAQIVTRSCGALMLTIGGILVQMVG